MGVRILGALSLAVFFVPLIAPLIQAGTLVYVLWTIRRGTIDRLSVAIGAGGAALGLALFLALQFAWIV